MKKHLLCLIVLLIALPMARVTARATAIVDGGSCGEHLTWTLDSDGVLTVSGTGAMDDCNYPDRSPWDEKRNDIKTALIQDGVTSIGAEAFSYCSNLTSVTIPNSTLSIGRHAFLFCESLLSVNIPDSVTSIDYGVFASCKALKSVTIPDSVTSVGDYAFTACVSLSSVALPNSVTAIGFNAFSYCVSLMNITIPASVTSISASAFTQCAALILVDSGNQAYMSESGVLFDRNRTTLISFPAWKGGSYKIPDSVASVGDYAFYECKYLTGVIIPDGVTDVGHFAFCQCTALESAIIPDSVTSIGNSAFMWCQSLTNIAIPQSVKSIGGGVFSHCSALTGVTIPYGVKSIGGDAFAYCSALADIAIPDSVASIGRWAFQSCDSLANIAIPDSVTSIGGGAFYYCGSLTDIYYAGSAAQWNETCNDWSVCGNGVTVHYGVKDIGVRVMLTDEDGKSFTSTGEILNQNGNTEKILQEGDEVTAKLDMFDADAVIPTTLVTANVFIIFYDKDGMMVELKQWEINLSDLFNVFFTAELRIPSGATQVKFLILSDNLEPLRATHATHSHLIEASPTDA